MGTTSNVDATSNANADVDAITEYKHHVRYK
jgi:hypothetical protein